MGWVKVSSGGGSGTTTPPARAIITVPNAASLPTDLTPDDATNLYITQAEGSLYEWDGTQFNELADLQGPKGNPAPPRPIISVPDDSALPDDLTTDDAANLYITQDRGCLYEWQGDQFRELAELQGPAGSPGDPATNLVTSVAGKQGDVVLIKDDVGLENVDNSKDEWKWVAAAAKLSNPVKVNGVDFDGTADIIVPSYPKVDLYRREWHDLLAFNAHFGAPTFETHDGGTWSAATLDSVVFDFKDTTYTDAIPEGGTIDGCRYTWHSDGNLPWSQFQHFILVLNNAGGAARTLKYTIQNSSDGTAWTDFGTLTSTEWSTTLDIPTSWSWGEWPYLRLQIDRTSGTGGLRMTSVSAITLRMGDQGGGREMEYPYAWDQSRRVSFYVNPIIPNSPTQPGHAVRKDYVDEQVVAGSAALSLKEDKANKGAVNGYASLDANQLIPAVFLPSYVDDVLEYANLAAFPGTGTGGKIYVALDNNKIYRWSGSAYIEISSSPGSTDAVPEGAANFYFTNARADARVQAERTATATLSNKRINPRVSSVVNQASWTVDSDATDFAENSGLTTAVVINNPTGTPVQGQRLHLALTGTAARAITYGTAFEASTIVLPNTTKTTATLDIQFRWNTITSKWRIISTA